jgi:hypothetical protein
MTVRAFLTGASAIAALGACVPAPEPTPTPAPPLAPAPAPTPAPAPPAFAGNWADAPATPGDWSYGGGTASFGDPGGAPRLVMRCDRPGAAIEIVRPGAAGAASQMLVMTEFGNRALEAAPTVSDPGAIAARVSVHDALLDAMAFSKGRFAIDTAGLPTLYIPSWAEITRVIEDCR